MKIEFTSREIAKAILSYAIANGVAHRNKNYTVDLTWNRGGLFSKSKISAELIEEITE